MNNKKVVLKTLEGHIPSFNDKEWQAYIKRSESKSKPYPIWVKKKFSNHDLKYGFMKEGVFYRPLYMFKLRDMDAKEGFLMPIACSHERASEILKDFGKYANYKQLTFSLLLGGFMSYTRSEGMSND